MIALIVVIVTDVVAIGSDWLEIRLMNGVLDGDDVSFSSLDSDDLRQLVVTGVAFVAFVAAAVFFLRWFRRAYANLGPLGSTPRFAKGWAIGGWFVPILWYWRPKQLANDIWNGSDPSVRSLHITRTGGAALLNGWWAAWIVAGFVYARSTAAYFAAPTAGDAGLSALLEDTGPAGDLRRSAILDVVASGVDIVAAVLAILVVRAVTARQVARAHMLAELPGPSPAGTAALE